MVLVTLESTTTQMRSYFNVDMLVYLNVHFVSSIFSATKQREINQKKKNQKTNTHTQENVNGKRRFTRVCRFLLHHGSRLSRIHCNPNEELFQRRYIDVTKRYIDVTKRSFRFVHFLNNQTQGSEKKKQKTKKKKKPTPSPKKM